MVWRVVKRERFLFLVWVCIESNSDVEERKKWREKQMRKQHMEKRVKLCLTPHSP